MFGRSHVLLGEFALRSSAVNHQAGLSSTVYFASQSTLTYGVPSTMLIGPWSRSCGSCSMSPRIRRGQSATLMKADTLNSRRESLVRSMT